MAKTPVPQRELDRLKQEAEDLWEQQQAVIARARSLAAAAGREAAAYARDDVAPKVRGLAGDVRASVSDRVVPAVTGAASSALAALSALRETDVRGALARLGRATSRPAPIIVQAAPKPRIGGWIALGIGVVVLGAAAYAVWQTLRADDSLWVEDEIPDLESGD